jgi:integrase
MELVYRIRPERLDRHGRATVTADLHWGSQRLQLSTGVKVLPINWQPTKKQQVNTREADANGKNLVLTRFSEKIGKLFTLATGQDRDEATITADEVRAAAKPQPDTTSASTELPPTAQTLTALHLKWQQENALSGGKPSRRHVQVAGHLARFKPDLTLGQLTRKLVADYRHYTQQQGVADSTFRNHVKWLREAFRTAGLNPPKWLAYQAPESHPLALTAEEFRRLVQHAFTPSQRPLSDERDVFVLQTLLLLRDSDMRRLRPGYVREMGVLLGQAPVLVASMPQKKTREPFMLPFCELAAQLWRAHPTGMPVVAQQNRNTRMKDMAAAVGLTREVMKVRWVNEQPHETPMPLCQALTSHAARHTGADLILAGSGGDRNLVEIALGHVNHVYGHDSIYRYGPQLLQAWDQVLDGMTSVGKGEICQRSAGNSVPDGAAPGTADSTLAA